MKMNIVIENMKTITVKNVGCVPKENQIIQIDKFDYIVKQICWTVDYTDTKSIDNKLRVIISAKKLNGY